MHNLPLIPLILGAICLFLAIGSWVMSRKARHDSPWVRLDLGTGQKSKADTMKIVNGQIICPDCEGVHSLLAGPSGVAAQNCACGNCLSEFNIIPGYPPIIVERMGKLSVARAQIYGISPEEWKEKQG